MTQDTPVRSCDSVGCVSSDIRSANYLNDLWLFDVQEYKWKEIVMRDNDRKPTCVSIISSSYSLCLTTIYQSEERVLLSFNS